MRKIIVLSLLVLFATLSATPIYIAFLWHMHQPIYWPYQSVTETQAHGYYSYSLFDIFNQRYGPYTYWPKDAVQSGINAGFTHFGAQVSFSGSLIENLNDLEAYGNGNFQNWKSNWEYIKNQQTSLGNPRIDMVGFGYHHPLMGLIDYNDIRRQIQAHRNMLNANFTGSYSSGIFPPECAFSLKMIPALTDENLDWTLIDNIHLERACEDYPFNTGGNLYEPNQADVLNPNPGDWQQLNGLWAPTQVSLQWAHTPHRVKYIDPASGAESSIIAVPASRYLGTEDARGGFGALNYDNVMSQFEDANTDSEHPILIVLHHDGDNYGGGTDSYYYSNFSQFISWLQDNPDRFVCTTIADYLEMFPPENDDYIHVESGSWSGADNGDPEFLKWNGNPYNGYSPDRNSWGVITAAKNIVQTAEDNDPNNNGTIDGWTYLMNAETSCYWYWDGSQNGIWDSHPTRGANLAVSAALPVAQSGNDQTPPTIYQPQREPYNPGGMEWNQPQSSDFTVWSYVYDLNGLNNVILKYRIDNDGVNSTENDDNETYEGGSDVGNWTWVYMTSTWIEPQTEPEPFYKANEYSGQITGLNDVLVDYYIEAIDQYNNTSRSTIEHVYVGSSSGGSYISWDPVNPDEDDEITITVTGVTQGASLHWGVNQQGSTWQTPNGVYWPAGSSLYNGTGPAVESPFVGPDNDGNLTISIGPFNNEAQDVSSLAFVLHWDDNTWDNNEGNDFNITISGGGGSETYIMDGQLDDGAQILASDGNYTLYYAFNGVELYLATAAAQVTGSDTFIFVSSDPGSMTDAPWAKNGQVAQWDAYMANESTNNYATWTDQNALTSIAVGSYLEGIINVSGEWQGATELYAALGLYHTNDNGELVHQAPAGNNDSNLDANEYQVFDLDITSNDSPDIAESVLILHQNAPNPFNPETTISFSIPQDGMAKLEVYNIRGQKVRTLLNRHMKKGEHKTVWNGLDDMGKASASGNYLYKLQVSDKIYTRKMLLLK